MRFNPLLLPTLLVAYGLFHCGHRLPARLRRTWSQAVWLLAGCALAVPGALVALYYLHFYDDWAWFYSFRTFPFSEICAGGAGLLAGTLAFWSQRSGRASPFSLCGLLALLTLGVALPHSKPILAPVDYDAFTDSWDSGVCRQSTGSSCGAASTATLLRRFGERGTELAIAKECFTSASGAENWHLARAFRRRGLRVRFITDHPPTEELPVPSIAGVRLGDIGHFIAILDRTDAGYVVGDPLAGRTEHSEANIRMDFAFTGFFMHITR